MFIYYVVFNSGNVRIFEVAQELCDFRKKLSDYALEWLGENNKVFIDTLNNPKPPAEYPMLNYVIARTLDGVNCEVAAKTLNVQELITSTTPEEPATSEPTLGQMITDIAQRALTDTLAELTKQPKYIYSNDAQIRYTQANTTHLLEKINIIQNTKITKVGWFVNSTEIVSKVVGYFAVEHIENPPQAQTTKPLEVAPVEEPAAPVNSAVPTPVSTPKLSRVDSLTAGLMLNHKDVICELNRFHDRRRTLIPRSPSYERTPTARTVKSRDRSQRIQQYEHSK